jgi:serine/threonine-protein kinase
MNDTDLDRTRAVPVDPLLGAVIADRYRLDGRLAIGGFGAIYHATDLELGRDVALKILHANHAEDPAVAARFRREGAALASLRDPHTVTAYEFGEARDGTLFIAMEVLHGESLHEQLRAGPLPWRRAIAIVRAVCESLGEAHALGIVHRDLKPANIFIELRDGEPDQVKVLDFGIAKIMHGSTLDNADLTSAGQMVGTFDYMAPEQMLGGECTGRTDLFSVGIVLYEMVCGERPFAAQTAAKILSEILHATPIPASTRSDAPPALDRVLDRCLHHDPAQRYAGVAELAADLDVLAEVTDPSKTRPMASAMPDEATWIDRGPSFVPATTLPGVAPPPRKK